MKNRAMSKILVLQMVFCVLFSTAVPVLSAGDAIYISDADGFFEFAKNCTLDEWSRGKSVKLMCDIDFSGHDFESVPTFGGSFDGNGHCISGITIDKKGSYQGIFRYLGREGKIADLSVSATVCPGGSKNCVGGIVGENSGTIENCSFSGTVKGENAVGGICGSNTDTGTVLKCTSNGELAGENSTGGIAGKNCGSISGCTNNAAVNTEYQENKTDLNDLDTDVGAVVERYKNSEEENEVQTLLEHSDSGGICGYSTGVIEGCENYADVGYKHIGYNTGGICGRQSGYILGCKNHGVIRARKDAGGICGQAEPYILLNASDAVLGDLRGELKKLNTMVNKLTADGDRAGDAAQAYLSEISKHTEAAGDSAEIMINLGTDFVDDNLGEINAQAAIIANTAEGLTDVFCDLQNAGESITEAISGICDTLEEMEIHLSELDGDIKKLSYALSDMSQAATHLKRAIARLDRAAAHLDAAVEIRNVKNVKSALSEMSSAIKDIITAKQEIKTSISDIERIIDQNTEALDDAGADSKTIKEVLAGIKDNFTTIILSLQKIKEGLDTVILNTEINYSEFKYAAESMETAMGYLEEALGYTASGLDYLNDAVSGFHDSFSDMSEDFEEQKENLTSDLKKLANAAEDITDAVGKTKEILEDLSNEDTLEFVKLGDEFKNANSDLFGSLSKISGELDGLQNTLSDERKVLHSDISELTAQFNRVMTVLVDEAEELKVGEASDLFIDVSESDIERAKQGKISRCSNFGSVEADRNTGGICGAMAIEYSKNPEDDIEKPSTLKFTYSSRAVISECVNEASVTGKKDCSGGICGNQELGTVYKCENYAEVESTNGNYVGGIAGKCGSVIKKCCSRSELCGKSYIGGIAGKGDKITQSCSNVSISGDEKTGAVCGTAENRESMYSNFFIDNSLGGVDGISYKDRAEPISYDDLKKLNDIPKRFISFSVKFTADGEVIEERDAVWGESIEDIQCPKVPEKDGFFGNWQKPAEKLVTADIEIVCEYQPYITVLSSEEKNESKKLALALSEGEFTDKARLHIRKSNKVAPKEAIGNVDVFDVYITGTDMKNDDTVKLRILNENKDKATAWILKNGSWERIKTTDRGKYLIIDGCGRENTICIKYEKRGIVQLIFLPIGAALLTGGAVLIKKKRKK